MSITFIDINRILNAEEESLNKLISFFAAQASISTMPHALHDNVLQQKMMVDDRLKRTQEQKILFQVLNSKCPINMGDIVTHMSK